MSSPEDHPDRNINRPRPEDLISPIGPREFQSVVQESGRVVVIEFYSTSCATCLVMRRMLMALAHSRPKEVAVYSINANYHAGLSRRLRIGRTPTVIAFRGGEEVGRVVGVVTWDELVGLVSSHNA